MTIQTQTALIGGPNDDIILSTAVPLPQEPLQPHELAVAVKAISLNPVDTKLTGDYHTPNAILGCDFAGEVTAVGSLAATHYGFQVGDRVAATVIGLNALRPTIGAFAEHTICSAFAAQKIPQDVPVASAAGGLGGLAWITVSWALFHEMGLPAGPQLEPLNSRLPPPTRSPKINYLLPSADTTSTKPATPVLVSGGASYTGTAAIQLLKLAGFTVLATCSPTNFDLVRSYGADFVFDYTSPTAAADIRSHTRNSLHLALDCITTPDTTQLCYAAMGRTGGRYVALDPYSDSVTATRKIVHPGWVFGLEPLGEKIAWGGVHKREANAEAREFLEVWSETMRGLVEGGKVRFHPVVVREGGLRGALEGLEEIRKKRVRGGKLVYSL
ncbi:zinc-binding alcohol dehydrogenase family protein [Aspergillus ibericus CBS 121593]|uniref:NAD(P)-binding protein n=1 Tax=Aspergillus ibericus CBS 121593 TaxID=1448316 RepID=A0A395GL70_9EURO|nr:NAD(P)-binding protein [Aspergillus ibericus CBS 121593]RAK95567.1 NAD(P)-binding protein [Aspergillus ibericus CBS 121593]